MVLKQVLFLLFSVCVLYPVCTKAIVAIFDIKSTIYRFIYLDL